jgi:hypothetical protein
VLTIAEVRAALGPAADGKSDDEIERLRDEFATFARALVGISVRRTQDIRIPAVRSASR